MMPIVRKSMEIASHPGKLVSHPLKKTFAKHYLGKRFARTLFVVDLIVLASIAVSVGLILAFTVWRPAKIVDLVRVDATVAPTDVVSGGLSTLIIRYENASQEELRFARLNLGFPTHFDLQDVDTELTEVAPQTYDLGTIPAGASGSLKLRGTMFGDVGGDQVFQSTLGFVYGPNDRTASKFSEHVFHPSHSTLALELILPDRLIEGQEVPGKITYKNTGTVDFPQIQVTPEWPAGFTLVSSDPKLTNGAFILNALKAGQEGTISFIGRLPDTASADFTFHPSFSFGDTNYSQDILKQTVTLLPSQLTTTTTFDSTSVTPGDKLTATISYQHTGELPITNVVMRIASDSPIFKVANAFSPVIPIINPGESGSVILVLPTNTRLDASKLSSYEKLSATIRTTTDYVLPDGVTQNVSVVTNSQILPITSPVQLESFGRYTSPQGDQIGRGPLPPLVDETTKYWVFMTVRGTTNALENVKMTADLGSGVAFTGKQSVSLGQSLHVDTNTGEMIWTIGSLPATLAPNSQVVSVAFEVAITPTTAMIGTTPTLLASPLITARDTFTGAFVSARGTAITTSMPYDSMAAGLGVVNGIF